MKAGLPLQKFGGLLNEFARYGAIALAIWIGWSVIRVPIVERAPPSLAVRLAPNSPLALRRGAEEALAEGRTEDAKVLAQASLQRAPFNAAALRVYGLAQARRNDPSAVDALTLAGNWSLRDDPAHAWLVEHHLRRGNYGTAFAHADTLIRRRVDMYPGVFELFTKAATLDPRAMPYVVSLVGKGPPWREAYLNYLFTRNDNSALVLAALAVGLENSAAPFTDDELERLYETWIGQKRYTGVRYIMDTLKRPSRARLVQNGSFSIDLDRQLLPFGWKLGAEPGLDIQLLSDETATDNQVIYINYIGFSQVTGVQQLVALAPGRYELKGRQRVENPDQPDAWKWVVDCADSRPLEMSPARRSAVREGWSEFSVGFVVAGDCPFQLLRLASIPTHRRNSRVSWFDEISIVPSTATR